MNKVFIARILYTIALATLILTGSFKAFATEDKKQIVDTICCRNGTLVGYANDCVASTSGNCVDHSCKTGASEETAIYCPIGS
jgi:hypothetical protein